MDLNHTRLPIPPYPQILNFSHCFNILAYILGFVNSFIKKFLPVRFKSNIHYLYLSLSGNSLRCCLCWSVRIDTFLYMLLFLFSKHNLFSFAEGSLFFYNNLFRQQQGSALAWCKTTRNTYQSVYA